MRTWCILGKCSAAEPSIPQSKYANKFNFSIEKEHGKDERQPISQEKILWDHMAGDELASLMWKVPWEPWLYSWGT